MYADSNMQNCSALMTKRKGLADLKKKDSGEKDTLLTEELGLNIYLMSQKFLSEIQDFSVSLLPNFISSQFSFYFHFRQSI